MRWRGHAVKQRQSCGQTSGQPVSLATPGLLVDTTGRARPGQQALISKQTQSGVPPGLMSERLGVPGARRPNIELNESLSFISTCRPLQVPVHPRPCSCASFLPFCRTASAAPATSRLNCDVRPLHNPFFFGSFLASFYVCNFEPQQLYSARTSSHQGTRAVHSFST